MIHIQNYPMKTNFQSQFVLKFYHINAFEMAILLLLLHLFMHEIRKNTVEKFNDRELD